MTHSDFLIYIVLTYTVFPKNLQERAPYLCHLLTGYVSRLYFQLTWTPFAPVVSELLGLKLLKSMPVKYNAEFVAHLSTKADIWGANNICMFEQPTNENEWAPHANELRLQVWPSSFLYSILYPRQLLPCITVYKSKAGPSPTNSEAAWESFHSFPFSSYKLNVKIIPVLKMLVVVFYLFYNR